MKRALPIVILMLAACGDEDPGVLPELLVPDEVEVAWDSQFDEAEGVGALLPIDLMVYDANSGEPMGSADLTVQADSDFVELLPGDAVENVDPGCLDCLWDAGRDRYVSFEGGSTDLQVTTDVEGLARMYIWVDALPNTALVSVAALLDPSPEHTFELRAAE